MKEKKVKKDIRSWLDERSGLSVVFHFLREKKIPQHKHSLWYYTGSAILLFFGIQVITGFMLVFYYNPTLEEANSSVARIMTEIPLGWIIRSVHSWSASFMIAFVFIHLLSIWITKAYRKPRELTWMSGVFLLVLSLLFGFTGYLLPWDDLSLSATKVGTDIPRSIPVVGAWVTQFLRGGEDVTGDTLTRFFGFHVCILPIFLFALLAVHVYLVQKQGMSLPLDLESKEEKVNELPFWPNFVYREMIVWLVLIGVLFTVSIFFPPSLEKAADLMAPAPEGIKPEWYFLFLFQMLKIFPSKILFMNGDTLVVLLILLGGIAFFFLPLIDNKPTERKGKIITVIAYLFIIYAVGMSVWSLL
ncbi:MAG: cytochrome bc complex cytochrome b subunit [Candidatus Aminicenantes bacterium]|nr:cytochrome bc complex cytochrome b subunit [Candidatus Aminicenantes bacterium]MDH5705475.1 cytochrome bc complex cytochrome b subunit [Candidatus Aminicenantes bacterium]